MRFVKFALMLGPRQAVVLQRALSAYAVKLGYDVAAGDGSAIREQQIALKLLERVGDETRLRGVAV